MLVGLVVGVALGARNLRQAELLARHHSVLLGDGASDSTLWRMLGEIDDRTRRRIAKARRAYAHDLSDFSCGPSDLACQLRHNVESSPSRKRQSHHLSRVRR